MLWTFTIYGAVIKASIPINSAEEKIGTNLLLLAFSFLENRSRDRIKKILKIMPHTMPIVITHIAMVKIGRLKPGSLILASPDALATASAAILS